METLDGFARKAVVLELTQRLIDAGSWTGETHIQKASFLLQEVASIPLGVEFVLYRHGPYSFGLRDVLSDMETQFLLGYEPSPPYGGRYRRTSQADQLVRDGFPKTVAKVKPALDFVLQYVGSKGVAELERLATGVYLAKRYPDDTDDQLGERMTELKPHIRINAAVEASRQAREMLAASTSSQ